MERGRFLSVSELEKKMHTGDTVVMAQMTLNSSIRAKIIEIMLKNEYLIKSIFNMNLLTEPYSEIKYSIENETRRCLSIY